jgi:alpha-L-fucosidase
MMIKTIAIRRWALTRLAILTGVLSLVVAMIGAPPARAELFNPRQTWMRNATAGLFLHWGLRTTRTDPTAAPFLNTDCAAWESEVTNSGWSANKWVSAAQKLHAQYIVLATFHSRLGYARPWPSKIPGSCSTKRDFLGETIAAAKAKGLKVILYMTDDPKWFWEGLQPATPAPDPNDLTKPSWFDSAAYTKFKGSPTTINLNTRPGLGQFSYDNFFEVMRRYGKDLGGFWIDNDNEYWEQHNLYQQIHQQQPTYLLSNNNEDTPEMDTVSNEQKTGMTPPYDYNSALWTSMPRLTESDYKLPDKGSWWYDGDGPGKAGSSPVNYKLNIGRLISNVGASSKALEAETSKENGDFPVNEEAFNNFAGDYLTPIWESIHGVEGGGYMYGGLEPGAWNDGAYGFTTISKTNPNLQYVHAIDKPTAGTSLTLRDNGYVVKKVTDVRTCQEFGFTQNAGYLTINGVTNWDPYDTVFKVEASGRTGIYPAGSVKATASVSAPGYDDSNLADGKYDYYKWWDNNGTLPATITLDLGSAKKAAYLAINQKEWSSTQPRVSFGHQEDSARIKDYTVDVSSDGTTWTPVTTGVMKSARAVQTIDLGVPSTRYVRLTVKTTWAPTNLTEYANKLKIDEMWVGSGTPANASGGTPAPAPSSCPSGGSGGGSGDGTGGTGGGGSAGGGLPITGSDIALTVGLGSVLITIGGFLVLAARRRRLTAAD